MNVDIVGKLLPKGIGKLQTPLYSEIGGWVILPNGPAATPGEFVGFFALAN